MHDNFKALKITENVYWVGAIDWDIRNFHGYSTSRGTTYNAYLIMADKITLIDTVKEPFKKEFLARISSLIDLNKIDYVISNHSEMDHSGLLPDIIDLVKPEKVFASQMGVKALSQHFHDLSDKVIAVKDGEKLSLGNTALTFFETRMLHWPDSMVTYMPDQGVLFSNDIFGMHLATYERFDDEIDPCVLDYEAAKYFANIILPYCTFVSKLVTKLEGLQLNLQYLATDHGPVWRKDISKIIHSYTLWPQQKPVRKGIVIYDSMWGSTIKMAEAIGYGMSDSGIKTKLLPISANHRSDIATEMLELGALVIGSPVLNSNLYPTVPDVMTYIKGLRPQNLITGAFGSYGWNESPLDQIKSLLVDDLKLEFVGDTIKSKYVPDKNILNKCYEYGVSIANRLKETC